MIADVANVGVSLAKGDLAGAGINAIAIVPVFGDAVMGGAVAAKVGSNATGVAGKVTNQAGNAVSAGGNVTKVEKNMPNNALGCFTAGTQIVVGAEYDENDIFVQYVTVNIEDIKVGDFVYSYDTITGEVLQQMVTAT